jgi:biotin carboxyl carrier protein
MSEKKRVKVDGEEFEVEIEFDGEQWDVTIEGKTFAIVVDQEARSSPRTARERVPRRVSSSGTISSAIPGKIVSIHVSEGEIVSGGDVVLVLEAMKMQNEIKATIGGVVKQVNCESGDRVEANVPLIEIESQPSEE